MDQPKDSLPAEATVEAPKDAVPAPTISAVETPTIDLPKQRAETPAIDLPEQRAEPIAIRGLMKRPRIGRLAQFAAAMSLAAAFGAFAGAVGASGFLQATAPAPHAMVAATPADTKEVVARLSAELATLKAGIENTTRNANTQFAKLTERFERAEKAQAEPVAKLARIGETLERLERRPPAAVPAPASADITGSIAEKQPAKPLVVEGWILRDIYDGYAIVESRRGMMEVGPGSNIPGVGRVETIKKQDGRWVVVTPKGIIVSAR